MADELSIYVHEINNSLNNIHMITQLIESEADVVEIKKLVGLIGQAMEQIRRVQNDYEIYRKTGHQQLHCEIINVASLIAGIIDEYKTSAEERNINIIPILKVCRVFTDLTKLKQVLSNIISNAIKYNKPNGTVVIECASESSGVIKITIKDTGIGMDVDDMKYLGNPFYRAKKINMPGTGLGFTLVKRIVNILSWELHVKSVVNEGTEITLLVKSTI